MVAAYDQQGERGTSSRARGGSGGGGRWGGGDRERSGGRKEPAPSIWGDEWDVPAASKDGPAGGWLSAADGGSTAAGKEGQSGGWLNAAEEGQRGAGRDSYEGRSGGGRGSGREFGQGQSDERRGGGRRDWGEERRGGGRGRDVERSSGGGREWGQGQREERGGAGREWGQGQREERRSGGGGGGRDWGEGRREDRRSGGGGGREWRDRAPSASQGSRPPRGDWGERSDRRPREDRPSGDRFGGERPSYGGGGGGDRRWQQRDRPSWNEGYSREGGGAAWKAAGDGSADADDNTPGDLREFWIGDVLYGVSPVLAALQAGRRTVHTLYLQDGMDLSKRKVRVGVCECVCVRSAGGQEGGEEAWESGGGGSEGKGTCCICLVA